MIAADATLVITISPQEIQPNQITRSAMLPAGTKSITATMAITAVARRITSQKLYQTMRSVTRYMLNCGQNRISTAVSIALAMTNQRAAERSSFEISNNGSTANKTPNSARMPSVASALSANAELNVLRKFASSPL